VKVDFSIRGIRCFRPGSTQTGNDATDAMNFYTKIEILKTVQPIGKGCSDDVASRERFANCRLFPGRFISRLRTDIPRSPDWPDESAQEISDIENIPEVACSIAANSEPGAS